MGRNASLSPETPGEEQGYIPQPHQKSHVSLDAVKAEWYLLPQRHYGKEPNAGHVYSFWFAI